MVRYDTHCKQSLLNDTAAYVLVFRVEDIG